MSLSSEWKRAGLGALSRLGIPLAVAGSPWRRQRLAVLCYHGIATRDEHEWDPALFITQEQLEARLRWLRERDYTVLPLQEGLERLAKNSLPPRSLAITFDDGNADFAALAWPLFEKYSMPATVYVTTFYSGRTEPVWRLFCSYVLWRARSQPIAASWWGATGERNVQSAEAREAVLQEIDAYVAVQRWRLPEKQGWAVEWSRALGVDREEVLRRRAFQIMTPEEIRDVSRRGADVQLHTHRHRTPLNVSRFQAEISDNRNFLRECTGKVAKHFCYPSGVVAAEFLPWLRESGVDSAVTCESGLAEPSTERLLLPRVVDTSTLTELEWEAWLTGVRLWLGKPKLQGPVAGESPWERG
jgi:peptidoglycan/xylan/chitin deacetylase (PgdA/CDA1 family)